MHNATLLSPPVEGLTGPDSYGGKRGMVTAVMETTNPASGGPRP
jgi:hypothetical protein